MSHRKQLTGGRVVRESTGRITPSIPEPVDPADNPASLKSNTVAFVVDRREIVEGRMAAMRVVPALDEVEDRHTRLDLGLEAAPVEQLAFERGEEALIHGVVKTVAH
jgi:hypothetical protein